MTMTTEAVATTNKSSASLSRLPPASEVVFPGLYPWSPISTTTLTNTLSLDKGLWGTWRNRRLTPDPMTAAWFRRTTGSPLIYRVDHILAWLSSRRGEQLDHLTTWRLSLVRDLGTEADGPEAVRRLAAMYARAAGPAVGDVRFTPSGFQAYHASLSST